MADFIVPKGEEFKFTMKVVQNDSFLPQDVSSLLSIGIGSATNIKVQNRDTLACITSVDDIGLVKIPDDPDAVTPTYLNGMISVTLPASLTTQMLSDRGDKVDGYYLKPTYQILVTLDFNDVYPTRTAMIMDVYVMPTECVVV